MVGLLTPSSAGMALIDMPAKPRSARCRSVVLRTASSIRAERGRPMARDLLTTATCTGGRHSTQGGIVAALDTYDVAIVGGGPVGVGLAVELGQRGIRCVLVERHLAPQPIPKGQNLPNRTLEPFYFWHCVDELRAARVMPPNYPIGGVTVYHDLTSPYFHAGQPFGGRGPSVRDFYFQLNERLPQYCTEAVLRKRLEQLPSVTTPFGWTAAHVEQDADGASVTIVPSGDSGGPFYSWSADTEQQINEDVSADQLKKGDRKGTRWN